MTPNEMHKARCDAIQRRGSWERLTAAIQRWEGFLGEDNLFDSEKLLLKLAKAELVKLEARMMAKGQRP
jgi:hypothetical protein